MQSSHHDASWPTWPCFKSKVDLKYMCLHEEDSNRLVTVNVVIHVYLAYLMTHSLLDKDDNEVFFSIINKIKAKHTK